MAKGEMTKDDIQCYRTNYDKTGWMKFRNNKGWIELPIGILDAVRCLCDEVERLNRWKKSKARRS